MTAELTNSTLIFSASQSCGSQWFRSCPAGVAALTITSRNWDAALACTKKLARHWRLPEIDSRRKKQMLDVFKWSGPEIQCFSSSGSQDRFSLLLQTSQSNDFGANLKGVMSACFKRRLHIGCARRWCSFIFGFYTCDKSNSCPYRVVKLPRPPRPTDCVTSSANTSEISCVCKM